MKVLNAKVNWMEGFINDPVLEILVDKIPNNENVPVQIKEIGFSESLVYGEQDGYVFFFYHDPRNEQGYCGRTFEVTTVDGTKKSFKGPWSSRAGVMNKEGFGPCVDVHIADNVRSFKEGCSFAGHVTLEVAQEAIKFVPGVVLEKVVEDDEENEFYYRPAKERGF